MSKTKQLLQEEEEEENNVEFCFHDSLDRLLSSTNTSCSCSPLTTSDIELEEDSDTNGQGFLKFPLQKYDVWISQPLSVEERRLRLLRQMGLSTDPSFFRHRPSLSTPLGEILTSYSNTSLNFDRSSCPSGKASGVIVRSKSDLNFNLCAEFNPNVSTGVGVDVNSYNQGGIGANVLPVTSTVCLNEPSFENLLPVLRNGELDDSSKCDGADDVNVVCMIKNLDNGKEFLVNEVRDDGMWEKIKEVGTGRQLTMEEFSSEMYVGTSPIVQELMRRQNVEDSYNEGLNLDVNGSCGNGAKLKKRRSWLKNIKNVANSVTGYKERRSSDERDTSSEKGGRRSSSATDDSQDVSFNGPQKVRAKQYGKSVKELTAMYKSQEIKAHNGSVWSIKFSLDGKYLASAGEDCVIHVWQVMETERKGDYFFDKLDDENFNLLFVANGSPELSSVSPNLDGNLLKKRRGKSTNGRKSVSLEPILIPETVFSLSENPIYSFQGHLDDVLDLSWSKSQQLLSSSMDKTVRLWDLSSKACIKIFSHSDYVTCIQFNPVDDRYFISGSLDCKVRIWSIPDRQVVDWNDLREMVTAACYTPDGQGALVGSYKGSCRLYNTSDNKLQQKSEINLQNKKKKPHQKKITGFQFSPGSTSEVLITSADCRIRVIDGGKLVHKFKGFRNANSQISASLTSNGKYAISASEDSYVYVWRHEAESRPNRSKGVTVNQSYEHFHCQDVSVAIPWPGMLRFQDSFVRGKNFDVNHPTTPVEETNDIEISPSVSRNSSLNGTDLFDRVSFMRNRSNPRVSVDFSNGLYQNNSAWGMVIVTASLRGEIRTFQSFGLPIRV